MQHDDTICTTYSARLPRNQHMHHLPTSDITRSSQDQIKLGLKNTVAISKWPQGAWSLPTILAQHHKYPTTLYPRYHGDHSGDHNHEQHLVSNSDPSGDHNHDQYLASNGDPSGDHNQLISNGDPSSDQNQLISNSDPSGDHNQLISSLNRGCY